MDPKKTWIRIKQRATITLWSQEDQLEIIIEGAIKSLPEDHDIGRLYKLVEKEAANLKLELPKGLMDIRLHDIRRTFGSYQAISCTRFYRYGYGSHV